MPATAGEPVEAGDLMLAYHLIELAVAAELASTSLHGVRAEIYEARRTAEQGLMSIEIPSAARATCSPIQSLGHGRGQLHSPCSLGVVFPAAILGGNSACLQP